MILVGLSQLSQRQLSEGNAREEELKPERYDFTELTATHLS